MTVKEKEIQRVLRTLGVNGSYIGFHQMSFALSRIVQDEMLLTYISKGLYVETASKFGTTVSCVERNMRTLIQIIWNFGDRELLEEMAGRKLEKKPGNGEFIDIIAGYLKDRSPED